MWLRSLLSVVVFAGFSCGTLVVADDDPPRIKWINATLTLIEREAGYGRMIRTKDGRILCCFDKAGRVWVKASADDGKSWTSDPVFVAKSDFGIATNPELLELHDGALLFCFNERPNDSVHPYAIAICSSSDGGRTWTAPRRIYEAGREFDNGCWEPAAIQMADGEIQLFFANESPYRESSEQEITILRSYDDGRTWKKPTAISFRHDHRDGMPVPLVLRDGPKGIAVAIEDNGLDGDFKPVILYSSLKNNWRAGPVLGDSPQRWSALSVPLQAEVYAGAPYIRQMPTGETILSCQCKDAGRSEPHMVVYVGNNWCRSFAGRSVPFEVDADTSCLWNSLFVKSPDVITALAGTTMQGIRGLWAIDGQLVRDSAAGSGSRKQAAEIVSIWQHSVDDGPAGFDVFFSNGAINKPTGRAIWTLQGKKLTMKWPDDQAEGGAWIDRCMLSADGGSFSGTNQTGNKIAGRLSQSRAVQVAQLPVDATESHDHVPAAEVANKLPAVHWDEDAVSGGGAKTLLHLTDGTILTAHSVGPSVVACFKSTDDGKSWQRVGTIASDGDPKTDIGDGHLIQLQSGEILFSYRYNKYRDLPPEQSSYAIKVAKSSDNGVTWGYHSTVATCQGSEGSVWASFLFESNNGGLQCYYDDEHTPSSEGYKGHSWASMKTWDSRRNTWSNRVTVSRAFNSEDLSRDGMCSVVQVGSRILCALESVRTTSPHKGVTRLVWSDDGGKTWSWQRRERQILYGPSDDSYNALAPWMIKLSNGMLLCVFVTDEDRATPDTPSSGTLDESIKYVVSYDNGVTWSARAGLIDDAHPIYLPGVIELRSSKPGPLRLLATYAKTGHGFWVKCGEVEGTRAVQVRQSPVDAAESHGHFPAAEVANTLPVPLENDLKESAAVIKDIFKDDLQQATTPPKKLELAKKFIEQAAETKDDPTGRYALLYAAKNLAVASGDLNVAMKAVNQLGRFYRVELLATKVAVIKDIAPHISSSDASRALCEAALQILPQLLAGDDYDTAKTIAAIAAEAARRSKDSPLAKQARTRVQEVEEATAQYADVKASAAILDQKPSDPHANLVVGKFQCFVRGNWKKGLPMLAMGDDAQLKALAEQDAADPGAVAAKVKVGDGWWALSETLEGTTKTSIQRRAGYWYGKTLPELSGLTKTKIEKRLASVPQTPDSGASSVSSAADIVGKYEVSWTSDKGVTGVASYEFLPTHLVLKGQKKVGKWRVRDEDVEVVFNDTARGVVVITPVDKRRFSAVHRWQNGTTATWEGKRVP